MRKLQRSCRGTVGKTGITDKCHLRMCRSCRRHHDMLMRDHRVTSVSSGQPRKERSEKKRFCLFHQDQVLCFHCRQCDVSICLHCKLTSHEGHATLDMAIVTLQAKEEVTSLVTTAKQQVKNLGVTEGECVCVCMRARACVCVHALSLIHI